MSQKLFKYQSVAWAAIILNSALAQSSAWSDETAAAPVEAVTQQEPQVDFRFPAPVMLSPGTAITEVLPAPTALVAPSYSVSPEPDFFDSDKAREQELTQEREVERQHHLEDRQTALRNTLSDAGSPVAAGTEAPLEIRPTLILPPGFNRQAMSPVHSNEGRSFSRGGFHEPACEDQSFKATINKLVERDQKLILKQARHTEAIRRLRNDEGQHPAPELLGKLPPFESALRTRISTGIPKASIAKRKSRLDRWIYNGQAEEKITEMRDASRQIKPRVKTQVESYGKFRQNLDKSQIAETSIKYLESYNAERAEVEHWIESFDRVCKSVAYLKKSNGRGMASVVAR